MSDDSLSFSDWLARARQGDLSARNRLFAAGRSFAAVVARVQLHRRLQAKVDPSDLVQQSLLEAHDDFDKFRGETSGEWFAWLKQVVNRNILDADRQFRGAACRDYRRERANPYSPDDSAPGFDPPADSQPSPSQFVAGCEVQILLAEQIEHLPEDYREVILLRNLDRLPFSEIAQRMNRSPGACQMLWMRAIEDLRRSLAPLMLSRG